MPALACAVALLAGCGDSRPATRVRADLDLPRPAAGPPDAGTAAGHAADRIAVTDAPVARLTGRVTPAGARLTVRGAPASVRIDRHGRFAVDLAELPPGATTVRLDARAAGARAWAATVRVLRRPAPEHVSVPPSDTTPPMAWTRLEQLGGRGPAIVRLAPVLTRHPHPAVRLASGRLRITSVAHDADGGTGRIRVSVLYTARCPGAPPRRTTIYRPPSAIEDIRISPGVRVPTERSRTVSLDLDRTGRGCAVSGEAYAEAIGASGRESVSDPIRFTYRTPG